MIFFSPFAKFPLSAKSKLCNTMQISNAKEDTAMHVSVTTADHKLADARSASQCINTSELQVAASNARTFGNALQRDGRVNEAAFWSKMGLKLADALVDISAGADARRERIIYQDLLRARLFDLRIAVDADDNLSSAKPDSATNRNLRRSMTEAR